MPTITKEEATHLDLILRYFNEKSIDRCNLNRIKKDILPNYPIEYCKSLVDILENQNPKLIKDKEYVDHDDFVIFTTNNISKFLENGGFSNQFNIEVVNQSIAQERNTLELEKLRYDVKNSKRIYKTYWYTFFFALSGFIYALFQIMQAVLKWNNHNLD
ncbi:MAG TPA: hypothetical protein VLZ75_01210 [Chitinophagales bacterium]|nr:hypothetical protein [Chitinophagales bacterium]